jgi:hypothetical protein
MKSSRRRIALVMVVSALAAGTAPALAQAPSDDGAGLEHDAQHALSAGANVTSTDWTLVLERPDGGIPFVMAFDAYLPHVAYVSNTRAVHVTWSFGRGWKPSRAEEEQGAGVVVTDPNLPGTAYVSLGATLHVTRNAGLSFHPVGQASGISAVSPGNSNVLWAADMRGLFKSSDRGRTWSLSTRELANAEVVANSQRDVYAAPFGDRLYRTRDGGQTWSPGSRAGFWEVNRFAVDPGNHEVVYAVGWVGRPDTNPGLTKSVDGGETWSPASVELLGRSPSHVAVGAGGRVYVVDGETILVSMDGGASFTSSTDGIETNAISRVFPHPLLRCVVYALTDLGVYRSINGAGTCERDQ